MVKEDFTISCHFRSWEEDFVCIFIRGYRVVQNEERYLGKAKCHKL